VEILSPNLISVTRNRGIGSCRLELDKIPSSLVVTFPGFMFLERAAVLSGSVRFETGVPSGGRDIPPSISLVRDPGGETTATARNPLTKTATGVFQLDLRRELLGSLVLDIEWVDQFR
jgi:hypothetical protein